MCGLQDCTPSQQRQRQEAVLTWVCAVGQDQKEREAQRQKELDELFAEAIKQPKVPVGAPGVLLARGLYFVVLHLPC